MPLEESLDQLFVVCVAGVICYLQHGQFWIQWQRITSPSDCETAHNRCSSVNQAKSRREKVAEVMLPIEVTH